MPSTPNTPRLLTRRNHPHIVGRGACFACPPSSDADQVNLIGDIPFKSHQRNSVPPLAFTPMAASSFFLGKDKDIIKRNMS